MVLKKKLGDPPEQEFSKSSAAPKLTLMSPITDARESLPPSGSVTTSVRQHVSTYLESRGWRYLGKNHVVNSALCLGFWPSCSCSATWVRIKSRLSAPWRPRLDITDASSQSPGGSSCSVSGVGWNYSAWLEEAAIVCKGPPSLSHCVFLPPALMGWQGYWSDLMFWFLGYWR